MTQPADINNRYGAALLILGAAVFTADVTVLRFLSPEVPFALIIFFRSISQLIIVSIWIALRNPALFRSARWPGLVVRGVTSLICWWLYYASFQRLDLALASTLTFTTSLFTIALAPLVLGERIGIKRATTAMLGFVGVIIASGLNGFQVETGVLFGLGSALAAALLIFQNRVLARTEKTATIMFWIGLVASLGTLPAALAGWTAITLQDGLLLALAGTLATFGMLCTVEAYRFGEVSALATFPYSRILFALVVGYFLFGELATLRESIGAAIIVFCGLVAHERRRKLHP